MTVTATELEPRPATCRWCGRTWTPRTSADPGVGFHGPAIMPTICPDCARAERQAHVDRLTAERLARWRQLCPLIYQQTDPARLPASWSERLAELLTWTPGPQGLLLIGPTGTGKTRAAWLLIRKLILAGVTVEAFDCVDFGHQVAERFYRGGGEKWVQKLADVPAVFFDDLGQGRLTDRAESELFGVVERRTSRGLPILATTNLNGSALAQRTVAHRAAPMIRRLREFCNVAVFGEGETPAEGGR